MELDLRTDSYKKNITQMVYIYIKYMHIKYTNQIISLKL